MSFRVTIPYVKENHLLILKHVLEGQEPAVTLSRNKGNGGSHFCTLPLTSC